MAKAWNIYVKAIDRLTVFGMYIAWALIVVMMVHVCLDIIMRSCFSTVGLNATEYSAYTLVAIVFFGVADTFRTNGFIRIEVLYNKIPNRWKAKMDALLLSLAVIYAVTLFYWYSDLVYSSYVFKVKSVNISEIPLFIPQSSMALGMILLVLQLVSLWGKSISKVFRKSAVESEEV